ncbi:MAG: hypothetical protein WD159_00795 [Patescibacteria group bacterium]
MEELAKLLGTTKEKLESLSDEMGEFTGRKGVPEGLAEKIKAERQAALKELGMTENSTRKEVLAALGARVKLLEEEAKKVLGEPQMQDHKYIQKLFSRAVQISKPKKGFFLKEEKAKELFLQNPPQNILAQLKYGSAEELLATEDLFEVFSALRFLEDRKWQNEVFFAPFAKLTPDDFEERPIVMRVLDLNKWGSEARNFTKKKFHNTTHLKELGVVIVIPVDYTEGALTRMFAMMFHYLNEVSFYAKYFKLISVEPDGFAKKFVSALRGDVRDEAPDLENIVAWVIMQRYLAKENPTDPRLLVPHISPEALHWSRASTNLSALGETLSEVERVADGLSFWKGKAHLCGFTPESDQLVSFNFEDNVFSLASNPSEAFSEGGQYTYHVREALWNRFFIEWFSAPEGRDLASGGDGEKILETLMIEEFGQGIVGLKNRSSPEAEE